ncbi:hemagglutinin repeat-containing protein [Xenorhabdus bovienii]|uniref:Hemolysin XhlA(Two-partner secretion family protein, TpsA) n=1 Tax=Xenorhabdus bovienii TaxID=40576 RepID=A0A0B6XEI9_XENBV|nr:hemagglutinin repeat-containing protein [Xenorhabdus bovienii]CDM91208.1 Hemolysin XhlA(two-partner secretion family protein, TpsA) [Xenorhabdus bovienii]
MRNKRFKLSPTGKFAASMAIILVSSSTSLANGITPGGDSAHQPGTTNSKTGAAVVNIVAPSQSGLSHNQYNDFNVEQAGVVFNNSLSAGSSKLAGELSANSNLGGHTAKIILNEVISRNPSLILGKQEIFGMAADYVLANPNGITYRNGEFINTNQVSLVVGNPLVENGLLNGFSTLGNKHSLNIGSAGLVKSRIVNLIAPKIDNRGQIIVTKDINIITGNNRVSTDGKVLDSQQTSANALDSYYLGSMQAGRIRLLNTAKGNWVNLQGTMVADDSINVDSNGRLNLEGAIVKGNDVKFKAEHILSQGNINEYSSESHGKDNYHNIFGGIDAHQKQTKQSLTRTKLEGKNITLISNQDNQFMATDIEGDNVTLSGANLKLNGQQFHQSTQETENKSKFLWKHNRSNTDEQYQQKGNTIKAHGNIKLIANKGDLEISGSKIGAGEKISLSAKNDVKLANLIETKITTEKKYQRNETAALTTGESFKRKVRQKNISSELNADDDLGINAGGNVEIVGAKIHAKNNLILKADKQVKISTQSLNNIDTDDNKTKNWGGVAGGKNKNNHYEDKTQVSSEITTDGRVLLTGKTGISITGSKVKGKQGSYSDAVDGELTIDNAVNNTNKNINERTGAIFNITNQSNKNNSIEERSVKSEVTSDADLKLISNKDINVIGSLVKSADELNINTLGNLNVHSSDEKKSGSKEISSLNWKNHFIKPDVKESKSISVEVGLKNTRDDSKYDVTEQKSSELNGGNIKINADKDVSITGSDIITKKGNADIKADNISLLSADESKSMDKSHSIHNWDVAVTPDSNKFEAGFKGTKQSENNSQSQKTSKVSTTNITGDLKLNATKELKQQGARHNVAGNYDANAGRVNNLSTENTESSSSTNTQVKNKFGISIKGKNAQPYSDVDLKANGSRHSENTSKTTNDTTLINANKIKLVADGEIYDQGTQYQATKNDIVLQADSHKSDAVFNHEERKTSDTTGDANLEVGVKPVIQSTELSGKGKGDTLSHSQSSTDAITGSLKAKNGITIRMKHDAAYQGTSMDAGTGKVNLDVEGNINISQADNIKQVTEKSYSGDVSTKLEANIKPVSSDAGGKNIAKTQRTTMAKISEIHGKQGVSLNAGNNLTLQGANVDGEDINLTARQGNVELTSAQDTSNNDNLSMDVDSYANLGTNNSTSDKYGVGINPKLAKNHLDTTINHNSHIAGKKVTLVSDKDTFLKGANITADKVTSNISGKLNIETVKNTTHSQNIKVSIGSDSPNDVQSTDVAKADVKKKEIFSKTASASPEIKNKLKATLDMDTKESLAEQSGIEGTEEVNLNVTGKTYLTGAKIDSKKGSVTLNTQEIVNRASTTYDKNEKDRVELPNSLTNFVTEIPEYISDITSGKIPFVKKQNHETKTQELQSTVKGHELD